jgi:stage II sporulation protein D
MFSPAKRRSKQKAGVMRRMTLLLIACLFTVTTAYPQAPNRDQIVRIAVLSLFHPAELRLRPTTGTRLVLDLDGESSSLSNDAMPVTIHAVNGEILLQVGEGRSPVTGAVLRVHQHATAPGQDASSFWLEVPGKLRRRYVGSLEVLARGSVLEAVVAMPLEIAVASIVEAESPPGASIEELKAQAVAARSFLAAHQSSHVAFDFCDTTHCQFLRSPPAPGSLAAKSAQTTRGLILIWHDQASDRDQTVPAMYARSCGGRTRTLSEIGVRSKGYPYYSVRCTYCSRHPEVWQREADKLPGLDSEAGRLAFNRVHGWGAIPSLPGGAPDLSSGVVAGRGIGHGLGLCQLGAASMARHGAGFAQILAHYYPNTRLTAMQ